MRTQRPKLLFLFDFVFQTLLNAFEFRLVLVLQNRLLAYMKSEFNFDHLGRARIGDSMHLHSYRLEDDGSGLRLDLDEQVSTDANGIARSMGLQATARVDLEPMLEMLESKISEETRLSLAMPCATNTRSSRRR